MLIFLISFDLGSEDSHSNFLVSTVRLGFFQSRPLASLARALGSTLDGLCAEQR